MPKNHLKLGETPLFTRFLMCASVIFFGWRPKSRKVFFNPKLGALLKKHGFEGSQVHPQKVYRHTHSEEEGGPGIHSGGEDPWFWVRRDPHKNTALRSVQMTILQIVLLQCVIWGFHYAADLRICTLFVLREHGVLHLHLFIF